MELRAALRSALPNAPPHDAQMVKEPALLHTTLARLLRPPSPAELGIGGGQAGAGQAPVINQVRVVAAVEAMSKELCGLRARFK